MRIDAEKGAGVDLAKHFNIRGYPTTVFVNSDGEEVERIVGYLPQEKFLSELQRIDQGTGTYASLENQVRNSPKDADLLVKFAQKVEERSQYSQQALDLWQKIAGLTTARDRYHAVAVYKVAEQHAMMNQDPQPLKAYIQAHPNQMPTLQAYSKLVQVYRSNGENTMEAETFRVLVEKAMAAGQYNANMLNGYAWRMTELGINLEDALKKVNQAVIMASGADVESRAHIMDTKAEVLWKLGRPDEAVQVIDQCITIQPDDDYYQQQKQKFLSNS